MARLEKKSLGEIRGRVGDIVGKVRNGKQYIASRPSKYTLSKAPHEVDKRSRFKVNGLFAKAIKESELLYRIWEKEKAPAASAYNKICKVNFKLCKTDRPSADNIITPGGFVITVESLAYSPDKIVAGLEPFDMLANERRIVFILLVCFYDPFKKELDFFTLKRIDDYDLEELTLTFNFNTAEKQIAKAYKSRTVFLSAVTEDAGGNIVRWSKSVSREL
jgi:hypothetical protein